MKPMRWLLLATLFAGALHVGAHAQQRQEPTTWLSIDFARPSCATSRDACKTDQEKARFDQRERDAQADKARRDAAVNSDVAKYGDHRRKELENLAAMREAAQRGRPSLVPPPGSAEALANRPPLVSPPPDKPAPAKDEESCTSQPVSKFNLAYGDTEGMARERVQRGNPAASCPEGKGGQERIECSSKTEAAPDLDKACQSSLKLCPRRVVWSCGRTITCNAEKRVCKSAPGRSSRQ